ncbi:lipopolysaccharide biosynthesis protein [Hahella ganghwensis]|uniref:lipopolysaccharide biosynthesis protein n=1 Tax=Hahella ganghwensis TaxID=286420 RepID=UPI00035F8D9C|nr:lipopolysaccharide biosynthesis protein [Hahella ganghwensis]
MSKVHKALAYSVFSKYINRVVNLASVVIIARLLTPDELGLFAIASAIALIASELKSFGVGGYLIREEEIDVDKVKRALGLSVLISWGAGFALVAASWSIESFYDKDDIALLIQILSLSFFLSPHIGVAKSLMARDFHFKHRFIAETSSQIAQFGAAVLFILLGYSYYSLAYSTATGFIVELIAVVILKPKLFVFTPKFQGLKSIAKFGVFVTFSNLFNKIAANVPDLIIGKLGTTSEVAYFSRGIGFLSFLKMTINSGVRPVVTPYLADKKREGGNVEEAYLNAIKMLSAILIPVLLVSGYASEPVIVLFFGDQWLQSAPLVSILCIWAALREMHTISPSLFITTGHERQLFYRDLGYLLFIIAVVYFTYEYGLEGIAWGMVFTGFVDFLVICTMLQVLVNISLKKQFLAFLPNLILAGICVFWAFLVDQWIDFKETSVFLSMPILGVTTGIVWLATLILMKHPLASELQYMARKLLKRS